MKKLYICRHAKSSWQNPDNSDFERPLNKRGHENAPFMGKLLAKKNVSPDLIFTSPANRAITTAKYIAKEIGFPVTNIILEKNFYDSSLGFMIEFIQNLDNDLNTVMLFGHNPIFTALSNVLSGQFIDNIPTCGIVELDFNLSDWNKIDMQSAELVSFEFPKKYTENY